MKYSRDRVTWLNRGWLPVSIGFCPSKKAWDYELKRMDVSAAGSPYPTADGGCNSFKDGDNKLAVLITIGDHIDKKSDKFGIVGLIAHECMHAWRRIRDDIGEKKPSFEFEAYALQYLVQTCCYIYSETRRKL